MSKLSDFNHRIQEILTENYSEIYNRKAAFTQYALDELSNIIILDDPIIEYSNIKGFDGRLLGEIDAISLANNNETLYMFYTIYDSSDNESIRNILKAEYEGALNKMVGFFKNAVRGKHLSSDVTSPQYEPCKLIYDNMSVINTVKLCVLSNCIIKYDGTNRDRIATKLTVAEIWDLNNLYKNSNSEKDHVEINIDFEKDHQYEIPFIEMTVDDKGYKCLLAMLPGQLLYDLYEEYNYDLLQNNVRYFLGFKGSKKTNANINIQETLRNKPHMFLAYNNGITATSSGVEVVYSGTNTGILKNIKDFQILNGGQTTASIFSVLKNNKDITASEVFVQMKLVVLSEQSDFIINEITKYSNSQSKIKYADFSITNKFNIKLQELSKTIFTEGNALQRTSWFFERVRGQYDQEYNRILNKEEKICFQKNNPKNQKFKKELVAKLWLSWCKRPFDAVKGEGTAYDIFINSVTTNNYLPSESFFKSTVGLIILYNYLSNICKKYANAKATIVTYTIALLSFNTAEHFDLEQLWKEQTIPGELEVSLLEIVEIINQYLLDQCPENKTILSYGKSKACWTDISGHLEINTNLFRQYINQLYISDFNLK